MKVAVKDANIFIDLELSEVMDLWFELKIPTLTTNLITEQLRKGNHFGAISYIDNGSITEVSLSFEELAETDKLFQKYSGIDFNDASVLFLAKQKNAMLLSGDQRLKSSARDQKVDVHGTIWIFDQLVSNGKLDGKTASEKMRFLLDLTGKNKRHLPESLCEEYINKWSQS